MIYIYISIFSSWIPFPPFGFYHLPQESRNKIFVDFVKVGGDIKELVVRFEASLEESQQSRIQWGFRPTKWLADRHGDKKAEKLIKRKQALGLCLGCIHPNHTFRNHTLGTFKNQAFRNVYLRNHNLGTFPALAIQGTSRTLSSQTTQKKSFTSRWSIWIWPISLKWRGSQSWRWRDVSTKLAWMPSPRCFSKKTL